MGLWEISTMVAGDYFMMRHAWWLIFFFRPGVRREATTMPRGGLIAAPRRQPQNNARRNGWRATVEGRMGLVL
jgi:hypothetical protein